MSSNFEDIVASVIIMYESMIIILQLLTVS
jgi:hypothetical protein